MQKFELTHHARQRVRQRAGISAREVADAWINEQIHSAVDHKTKGRHTHYFTEQYEIICDGKAVVTIKYMPAANKYIETFRAIVGKEAAKQLTNKQREFRKLEIEIAQYTLNYLKARNPKIREGIKRKLTQATDDRVRLEDEIRSINRAAKQYGVEVLR